MNNLLRKICNKLMFIRGGSSRLLAGHLDKNSRVAKSVKICSQRNLYLYENTNIDQGGFIMNTRAKFIMKRNSGAAFGLTVVTGNHMSIPTKIFKDVSDKDKDELDLAHEYDKDVIVNEDVWIGSKVTLLSGVIIGRGAIIGSGSVVRTKVPPYAVVMGNPAKLVGFRFTPEEIELHEKALYEEKDRISMATIKKNYEKYYLKRINEITNFIKL